MTFALTALQFLLSASLVGAVLLRPLPEAGQAGDGTAAGHGSRLDRFFAAIAVAWTVTAAVSAMTA